MGWFTGIMVFVVMWFLILFMVLPWGAHSPHEAGQSSEPGHMPSAPSNPRIGLKFLITTGLAIVGSGIFYLVASSDLISFRP
jgi:predicted secreted protein